MRLKDGRELGYCEYGDPQGRVVVSCHGGLGSRLDGQWADQVARELGVRVVAADRPGIGSSQGRPGRTLLDWPEDVAELVDALGIDRFAVMGWSAGGAYAAACSYRMPERISAVGLIASVIPADWPGMPEQINTMDRVLMQLSRRRPALARAMLRAMGVCARSSPTAFGRLSARRLSSRAHRDEQAAHMLAATAAEGLRNPSGVVDDYRVMRSSWGFDPVSIERPVTIWQGGEDQLVPPQWAQRLVERIRTADVNLCPNEGHLLSRDRYREILAALSAAD